MVWAQWLWLVHTAIIAALTKEVERLTTYAAALEDALRAAGGDPATVVVTAAQPSAEPTNDAGGVDDADAPVATASSGDGGGGSDVRLERTGSMVGASVMEVAKLQAELERMESKLR